MGGGVIVSIRCKTVLSSRVGSDLSNSGSMFCTVPSVRSGIIMEVAVFTVLAVLYGVSIY